MIYLYIDEDGDVRQSNKEPDDDDLQMVSDGGLQILQCESTYVNEARVEVTEEVIEAESEDEEDITETIYTLEWTAVAPR